MTATLTASLAAANGGIDTDNDGKADPSATVGTGGDTIAYVLSLGNTTGTDATGLSIANPLDSHTTMVPGSLNSTPVAFDLTLITDEDVNSGAGVNITLQGQDPDGTVAPTFTFKKSDGTALPSSIATAHGTVDSFGSVTCTTAGVCSLPAKYTPTANYNGPDSFTFRVNDGTVNSNEVGTVSITVNAVNDAPTFSGSGDPGAVSETAVDTARTVNSFRTNVSAGPPDESGQTVTAVIESNSPNDHPFLFTSGPTLTVSGTNLNLTYTQKAHANGTATIKFHLHDTGGTANGGVADSATQTFVITVNAVNDAPVAQAKAFTVQANMKIVGLTGLLTGVTDADATNGAADSLSFDAQAGYTTPSATVTSLTLNTCTNGTITNLNASTGTFDFDPPPGLGNGSTCILQYQVTDTKNPAPGVVSATQNITITAQGPLVWFVKPGASFDGNGTLSDTGSGAGQAGPFNSLASASTKLGNLATNQKVFVYSGTLSGATQVLDLKADNDWLVGQGTVGGAQSFSGVTTLNGGITNVATSVVVTSATGIQPGTFIQIDSEQMYVVSKSGATLTVTRAFNGTAAASHLNGANVSISSSSPFDTFLGLSPTPPAGTIVRPGLINTTTTANGLRPTISGTVTMRNNSQVTGFNSVVTGADTGLKGIFTSGTSLIKDVSVTSVSGAAVDLSGSQTVTYQTSDNTNSPNILTSSTGGALSVVNSTIGGSGFTFRSVTTGTGASGPAKGIALNNTGAGPLTITGDGTNANSGGIIQHTGGTPGTDVQGGTGAIDIRGGSGNYSFNFMKVLAPGGDGVFILNSTGTISIVKSTIDHNGATVASSYGLRLQNGSGSGTLTLDGVLVQSKMDGTTAVSVATWDTGNLTFNVQDSNTGDGFPMKFTNLFGSGMVVGAGDNAGASGTTTVNVSNAQFVSPASNGSNDLEMAAQQNAVLNFNVHDNTFDMGNIGANAIIGMINVNTTGSGRIGSPGNQAIINNNIIKNLGQSAALTGYQAIRVAPDDCVLSGGPPCTVSAVTHRLAITNNQIQNVWHTAVNISARGRSNLNLNFANNIVGTIANPVGKSNRRGVLVETQAASSVFATITGNTIVNAGTSNSNSALALRSGTDNGEDNANGTIAATMSGNTIKNTGSAGTGGWFRAETINLGSGVTAGNMCLDYNTNTLKDAADANAPTKEFNLVHNSTGTFQRRNGGSNVGTETTSGTITTIATGCTQPSFAMFKPEGSQQQQYSALLNTITGTPESAQNAPASSLALLSSATSLSEVLHYAPAATASVSPVVAMARVQENGPAANVSPVATATLLAEAKVGAVAPPVTPVDKSTLSSFASAIAAMIEPTAHAEETGKTEVGAIKGVRSQESGVGHATAVARGLRSDLKANHAIEDQGSEVRNHTEPVPLMFTPIGQFPINGTGAAGGNAGFTLPTGKTITITFKATLNTPPGLSGVPPATPKVTAQATLTGTFTGNPLLSDDPSVGGATDPTSTNVDLYDSTSTITGASPSNSTNTGQAVTFTAAIGTTGTPNGSATARTGSVKFQDNGLDISGCTAQPVSSNQATCTTSGLSTGTHNNIKAIYNGDGNFDPSTSAAFTQTVTQNGTTTAVTSSQNPSLLTQNVTFTATVTSTGAITPPTGTVQFHEGATNFGAPVALTTGGSCPATKACASFSKSDLTAGAHTISGDYIPDPAFTASSGSVSQQVNQSDVTVAVSSSQNPSFVTQGVSFTAQVSSNTVITGPPTGTVQFKDGVSNIGSPVALTTGGGCPVNKACATSITISTLTAGNHTITAEYSGDTNFAAFTGTLSGGQQVNKSDTTTALASSLNPSIVGNSVKFTATVTSNTAVTGPPAGKAQFFDGINPITCTDTGNGESGLNTGETLNGSGVATCTTTTLTVGSHNITATYTGDGTANGSATFNSSTTTPPLVQVVNTACTTPITVMNTNDSGAGSLRQALIDVCDPGTITFDATAFAAPGPYTINLADTVDNWLLVDKSVTITGPGASVLIVKRISGATKNFRVFKIASGKTVGISGMTITNGSVVGDAGTIGTPNGGFKAGGGIYNDGTLTLTNVIVSGNSATGGAGWAGVAAPGGNGGAAQGGGIFSSNPGSLTLINSTVSGNTATGGAGGSTDTPADANGNGGAGQGGGIYSTGNLTLTNSTIGSGNSSVGGSPGTGGTGGVSGSGDGGGVYDDGSGSSNTMSITGSTINGNSAAANGGGIFVVGASNPINAIVNITNSTISGNHANNDGGGISNAGGTGGTTTLTSVTITGNTCDNDNDTFGTGGGINVVSGTFLLKNTIIAGNLKGSSILQGETATVVGTITTGGDVKVTITAAGMPISPKDIFVTVANGDTASDVAGKIRAALPLDTDVNGFFTVTGATDQIILTTRTAAANDPTLNIATDNGSCAGLTAEPTSVDSPAGRAASDIAGTVDATSSFDLIGDAGSAGGLTEPNANNNFVGVAGVGIRHITTILNSTLANNGGPTQTHALVANSVALDNGNDFSVPATTDQRGFVRPVDFVGGAGPGDDSDIGAYEQQNQPAAPSAPDLDAASDTGVSNTDDNTADTTPTFTIAGVASGAFVELLRDDDGAGPNPAVVVASGVASGTSIQLTDPNATPDGVYRYTARQTVSGAPVSNQSAFLDVTINTTTPASPDAPDLDPGSDSGTSSTDNLTKFTNLTFTIGNVTNGNTVTLLRDTVPTTGFVVVATGTAAGSSIQLSDPTAPQGTYVYKSRQSNGVTSTDSTTTLTVVVDTTAPAAPGTPDLQAASDTFGAGTTGTNSDDITNAASRAFSVAFTAEAGSTVTLLRGGTPVTLGTPSTSGASSPQTLTDADVLIANTYLYTVQHTDAAGNSSVSAVALSVVFDNTVTASVPDLQAASDSFGTGTSGTNSDDLTKTTPRSFDVAATESGSLVELLRGGSPITSTAGTGSAVTLTDSAVLADNTYNYAIRETDKAGNVNTSADLPVTIDTTADTPNTPDLQSGSDAGASNTDNRTDNATHSFDIGGTLAGNFVELLRDGTPVNSVIAGGASVTLTDSASLGDGVYHYTARQTDKAGNGPATSAGTLDVTIDTTAPLVSSITRANANPTSAASVDFTVTFSEPVQVSGVDLTDFVLIKTGGITGESKTSVTPIAPSGSPSAATQFTVTVNTGGAGQDGTLRLDVVDDDTILDLMNLPLGGSGNGNGNFHTGEVYNIAKGNPAVQSITRVESDPTNLNTVNYTVTFSQPVNGVNIGAGSDFTLTKTGGITGESITGLSGSGAVYTVTVNTGSGDGTLRLNVVDDDTIVDVATGTRPLGGAGAGNGNFDTAGEPNSVFTVDKSAPTVTINQRTISDPPAQIDPVTGPSTTTVNFIAVFSEPVVSFSNAQVTLTGSPAGSTATVTQLSPTKYNVGISGMTASGTITVSIAAGAVSDAAGNGNSASTSTDNSVTFNLDNFSTFEVNSTADPGDGVCDPIGTGDGCTLREAINAANNDAGAETITFNSTVFAAPGPYTINLTGALPDIVGDVTISGPGAKVLTVKRNTGGNYRIFTITSGNVTIDGLTINNGNAAGSSPAGDGGGIWTNSSGTVNITNSAISGNSAAVAGGGIYQGGGTLNIISSTLSGNSASQGGGAEFDGSTTNITNSTISGNSATQDAGGIGFLSALGATITDSTITNNLADSDNNASGSGGGIFLNTATATLRSSIVAGNFKGTSATADDIKGTMDASSSYNLIGTGGSGGLVDVSSDAVHQNQVGVASPGLDPLGDNGGPTMTHSLLCTSPAIDKGNAFGLTTDQRGGTRPFDFSNSVYPNATGGDGSDIGAFESQAAGGCLPTAVPPSSPTTTSEDTPVTITLTGTYSHPNTPLTFTITQQPLNAAALTPSVPDCPLGGGSQTCTATVTYSPNLNFNGTDSFKFKVSAGPGIDSDPADVPVTVSATNDPPSFAQAGNQTVLEDAGPQSVPNFVTTFTAGPPDESGQTVQFIVTNNTNPGLFSAAPAIDGAGTLTYTPAANANGSATITMVAMDNGGGTDTSAPQSFTITVLDVNDTPSFGLSADPTSLEDAGAQTVANFATSISAGPPQESGQTLQFIVTNNTNPGLFSSAPAISPTGTLTYTAVADANGTAAITVVLKDNGGTANGGIDTSAPQTFNINVTSVNDVPSFVKGADQLINEDAGQQTINSWATALSSGPANESSQALNFIVTNNNNSLFSGQPAISPSGVLTYTSAPDANGSATVSVQIHDNGGTANGGQDTSAVQQFTITVNPVNDAPVNTVPIPQQVLENGSHVFSTANANRISVADVDAASGMMRETLTATNGTITLSTTAGLSFTVGDGTADPTMTFTGTLANVNAALQGMSYNPTNGFSGAATLTITSNDQGNTGAGGPLVDTDTVNLNINDGGNLQLSAATYTVGENSGPAVITINRTGGSAGIATVKIDTSNGTATAGSDYTAVSQLVTFNDGETSKTVNVPITDDLLNEPDETVNITLSNVGGTGALGTPATAVLTITNDDPTGGYVKFSTANYNVNEGGVVTITVQRVGTLTQPVTIDFATSDNSDPASFVPCAPTPGNTLATSRCDFETAVGRISFAAGDGADKTFTVMTQQDNYVEGPETLTLTLSNATGGAAILGLATATLTINDDVVEPPGNAIDDTGNFVESLYRDFLNRPSDPSGKAFWVNNIDKCNNPATRPPSLTQAQCIAFFRVSTATAYFQSDEFQQTGGTAYLTNHAAYGNLQPVFIRFEFDAQMIGKGYVFGAPGAAALLEANKVAYFNDYVSRTEFVNTYGGVSNQQYVDTLTQNTGVQWGVGEKQQLVNGLNNGTETRATVLRKITEKPSFRNQEMEPMFVLMEYFGFLRRNPDQAGFNFWLNKLHNANGDPIQSEMVKAFVESNEYRQRFGQ